MLKSKLTYLFGFFVIFLVALSCSTAKRIKKAEAFLDKKGKLPEICATRFPPKDSIVYRDSIRLDTLYEGIYSIDTIYDRDTVKVYLTTPAKVIVKEVVKYRDIYRENTARVEELQRKNAECISQTAAITNKNINYEKEIIKLKAQSSGWEYKAKSRWWFLWILLLLSLGITFRKGIFKISKKFMGFPL